MNVKSILLTSLICLFACITFAQSEEKIEPVKEEVRIAFNAYKTAILNDQGEEATKHVDSRTMKYYGDMAELCKTADSMEIAKMGLIDKITLYTIRHRAPVEEILKFDGHSLLIYAFKEGMVGKNSVMTVEIGDVEIDDKFAKGQLVSGGQPAPMFFHFYNEENAWKLDLTSLFSVGEMSFQQMLTESEMEEDEYLFMLLEMLTGTKPDNSIYNPPKL